MTLPKSLDAADCAVFGVLTALGYLVGIYFSVARQRTAGANAEMEAFLGGRSLPASALTVSILASAVNAMSVITFLGHFYGHGFHIIWLLFSMPLSMVVTSVALVPLLYDLRTVSIFQYLRLRFDNKVGITACVVYFVFSQTLGAVGIFSAAVGISTMFPVPLLYSNMAIGLAGTIYTALGGLRSVVWADCIQALVMLASPLIIIGKIIYDSGSVDPPLRPLSDFDVTHSMLRTEFDLTSDENVWSGLAGTLPFCLVRVGFDQMPVQRFMAAKTLRQARWVAVAGAACVLSFFALVILGAVAMLYWYRDCDPLLAGAITTYDRIVPYFIKERLSEVTMLRGLFLAGLLGASTSTVSSVVNSHAAIFYIDVVTPFVKMGERKAVIMVRLLALASGIIMTFFATAVPYMGAAAKLFLSLYSTAGGPFAGLVLLAMSSPWVNAKGTACACLLVCAFQLWHAVGRMLAGASHSVVIPGTLDRCPLEANHTEEGSGVTATPLTDFAVVSLSDVFPLYQVSFLWIAFMGLLLTMFSGTALSLATGGAQEARKNMRLTSPVLRKLWCRFKIVRKTLGVSPASANLRLRLD
ncbi:sodium-coupled monocarboxylate transporter 1-like [Amblyomma americanum]